ncbi:hypothetical protein L6452_43381 [Arctium lappa]|uniref:Uncharacterized protein n=1 Tax=Arctium lappa TaxID=4217 RepID=A0ACB8XLG4_ARCLA|nr:hypothetical protein L6452_43381 [Arctium lappa]
MQSRLILVRSKVINRIFSTSKYQTAFSSASSYQSHGGSDHPQMELDAMTQGVDTEGETNNPLPNHDDDDEEFIPTKHENLNHMHPKTLPPNFKSKLETPGVNAPFDPHHQQKRTKEELSCGGLDPWPAADHDHHQEQLADDDKHYFEHHKASPLSEIEILDTRKPLTRVTDGTAGGGYFGDQHVITWRPDQLDTAEESLRRATEMFREAAQRGVPDWPHSRRLRQLRGEDW